MDFERRGQQSPTPEDDSWSKKLQGILAEHGLLSSKQDAKPKPDLNASKIPPGIFPAACGVRS